MKQHQSKLGFFYRVSDTVLIVACLYLVTLALDAPWSQQYALAGFAAIPSFYLFAETTHLYRSWRGIPWFQYAPPIALSWSLTLFALLALGYATKTTASYSRLALGLWFITTPIILLSWRLVIRQFLGYLRGHGYNSRRVAIAGTTEQGLRLARLMRRAPSMGYQVVGFHEEESARDPDFPEPLAGNFDQLIDRAERGDLDRVYIAMPFSREQEINRLLAAFRDTAISVYLVPDLLMFDLLHARWVNVGPISTIGIQETPFLGIEGWAKRLEDLIVSGLVVLVMALPMLMISLAICTGSPGPVIFRQTRYGLDGRCFLVWKFRTMNEWQDGPQISQVTKDDPRVTRFGAWLRRTSLDELPQFFNVLLGTMSVVGPRPHAVAHNEEYRQLIPGYMLRHKVKPGITGWAQINGWRGETDTLDKMAKRVELDLWYIRNWSILLDLKIIIWTLQKGFTNENAY